MKSIEQVIETKSPIWKEMILGEAASLKNAIESLNKNGLRLVLICNQKLQLLGTISDGDIRRAILRGVTLEDSVITIMNRIPITLGKDATLDRIQSLMRQNKILQIPIIDNNGVVIDVRFLDDLNRDHSKKKNTVFIMAGGKGVRLRPHTENCPKPMLLVAGRPILEHIILRAREQGYSNFNISINYLGHMIRDYFGNGSRFNVNINYVEEVQPLGTAGSLSLLTQPIDDAVLIINGDILADINYEDLISYHKTHKSIATMAVRIYELQNPFGTLEMDGINICGIKEKPIISSYINAGIYILEPSVLSLLSKDVHCDITQLFESLIEMGKKVVAYKMHEQWIDVGNPLDLKRAENYI